MIMGVEAPKLMGSIVLWVGMSILGFNAIGIGMAVGYWIFYNKAKQNAGMKGGVVHTLWRNGLWADGKNINTILLTPIFTAKQKRFRMAITTNRRHI